MSALALAVPNTVLNIARPLLGLGVFASLLMVFKPLATGVLRVALLVLKPRHTSAERRAERNLEGVLAVNRMVRELETSQPNLAAELRNLASRD